MNRSLVPLALAAALAPLGAAAPAAAQAQPVPIAPVEGTRLDVVATGEARRVPDLVVISAGVMTEAPTAQAALRANNSQMESVFAALRRAGIAERDIRTASISLSPRYDYENRDGGPPRLVGYTASNQLSIRFREIERAGPIIDALVAEGVNQINGPNLQIENPETALDEARRDAIRRARERAEVYASAVGMSVGRIVAISESGASRPPMPYMAARGEMEQDAALQIAPGEQELTATVSVTFELE